MAKYQQVAPFGAPKAVPESKKEEGILIMTIGVYEIPSSKRKTYVKKVLSTMEEFSSVKFEHLIIVDPTSCGISYDLRR